MGTRSPGRWLVAQHAHSAFRTVEGALVARIEAAVGTDRSGLTDRRYRPLDSHDPHGTRLCADVVEEPGEQARRRAFGVAAHALAAPAHDCSDDHVACRLVPVGDDAADDRVEFGISTCM